MVKKLTNAAILYALLAMVAGIFYREFTKYSGFTDVTALSLVHTHYFTLGMMMFMMFALLQKSFGFLEDAHAGLWLGLYHVGLNVTVAGLVVRGILDVQGTALSAGLDASISGVSGLGHAILGVSMIVLLFRLRKHLA